MRSSTVRRLSLLSLALLIGLAVLVVASAPEAQAASVGRTVAITTLATRGDRDVQFLTTYLAGDTELVIRRDVRADGAFSISYELGVAQLSLVGAASDGSSFADLRVGVRGDAMTRQMRLGSETRRAEIRAIRTDLDRARRTSSGVFGPHAQELDRLLDGIERYLADVREVQAAVPRLGDAIVRALLSSAATSSGEGESLASGGASPFMGLQSVIEPCGGLGCRDCCAKDCDEQCAFECTLSTLSCRVCMAACGIGCWIGCL
jgi:hypothetical protein